MIAEDEIKEMKTIFDDMGTLSLEKGEIRAYGTEIGAFVRLDDLDTGYAYRTIDRRSSWIQIKQMLVSLSQ